MFCFQCEQTARGEGCTKVGVCGKQPDVAALQDLLIYTVKGLSLAALAAGKVGIVNPSVDQFTFEAIFSTLTNVDFDPQRFDALIRRCVTIRDELKQYRRRRGRFRSLSRRPGHFYTGRPALPGWSPRGSRWELNRIPTSTRIFSP